MKIVSGSIFHTLTFVALLTFYRHFSRLQVAGYLWHTGEGKFKHTRWLVLWSASWIAWGVKGADSTAALALSLCVRSSICHILHASARLYVHLSVCVLTLIFSLAFHTVFVVKACSDLCLVAEQALQSGFGVCLLHKKCFHFYNFMKTTYLKYEFLTNVLKMKYFITLILYLLSFTFSSW